MEQVKFLRFSEIEIQTDVGQSHYSERLESRDA